LRAIRHDRGVRRVALSFPVIAVLGWAGHADAMPTSKLVYVRDPGAEMCPEEEELRAAVAARLGYNPFRVVADNTLFAEVRRGAPGFVADVKLVGEHGVVRGERHMTSASNDCKDIALAMALSMSIALDPLSLTRPPGTPPVDDAAPPTDGDGAKPRDGDKSDTPPPRETVPPPPEPERPTPRPKKPAPAEVTVDVALGAAMSFGASPDVSFGAQVGIAPRYKFVSLEVGGLVAVTPSHSTSEGGSIQTNLFAGTIGACANLLYAFLCAKSVLGDMSARSTGVTNPQSQDLFFAAVGPRAGVNAPITRAFDLRLAADALFVATPFSLTVNQHSVYSSTLMMVVLGLDGVFHF
jgi:hypothetical protein